LPQIRCTQCGAVNDTGAADHPFCVGCQDNLAKCGSCQWFDDQLAACTQPGVAGLFDVSAEATPPCQYHTFRPSLTVRSRTVWAVVALGFAAAVFTLAYALLELHKPIPPRPAPHPVVKLELDTDERAIPVGARRTIRCDLHNVSQLSAKDVRLLIRKDFFRNFDMPEAKGKPHGWREEHGALVFRVPELAPGEHKIVALEVAAKKAGEFQLVVTVESNRTGFHGQVSSLIKAAAAAPAAGERKVEP